MSAVALAVTVSALASAPVARWQEVQRLQDTDGQPHVQFGESLCVADDGKVFVGASTANIARGFVRIIEKTTAGLPIYMEVARLRNAHQNVLDGLGFSLACSRTGTEVFAGAPAEKRNLGKGYVDVVRHTSLYEGGGEGSGVPINVDKSDVTMDSKTGAAHWKIHQRLHTPDEKKHMNFGRNIAVAGDTLAVASTNMQTFFAARDTVGVINQVGTRAFLEAYGRETAQESVHIYTKTEARDNVTSHNGPVTLKPTVNPDGLDFGKRLSFDETGRFLAVSAPVRFDSFYGHGTDGELVVTGITTLDGSAEFNFRSVTVKSGGILTVTRRDSDSKSGGVLTIRVQQDFIIEAGGVVNVTALGYGGGPDSLQDGGASLVARQGESAEGLGTQSHVSNSGGGGSGVSIYVGSKSCVYDGSDEKYPAGLDATEPGEFAEACGGGGGYGTAGDAGTPVQCGTSGLGGDVNGDPWLDAMDYGGGGGSGHPFRIGSGGAGGNGGGIVNVFARRLTNRGVITSNGADGINGGYFSGGGGGGAGGSIRLQGEEFGNFGSILAKGGQGGLRSVGSGSEGTLDVKGGNGGDGRIRLAYTTVLEVGVIDPAPMSKAVYTGDVYVFEKLENATDPSSDVWVPHHIARQEEAAYMTDAVAIENGWLACVSDTLLADPAESNVSIYLYRWNDSSGEFSYAQQLVQPDNLGAVATVGFGALLKFVNGTLLITSSGSVDYPGVVWMAELSGGVWAIVDYVAGNVPAPGDGFGLDVALLKTSRYQTLYVLTNSTSFVGYPIAAKSETTAGGLYVFQYQYTVSVDQTTVSCRWAIINAETSMVCTISAKDAEGTPVGYYAEMSSFVVTPSITSDAVQLELMEEGTYQFVLTPHAAGALTLSTTFGGDALTQAALAITVTADITPLSTTVSCNASITAGQTVWCHIAAGAVGEESASEHFSLTVVNTDAYKYFPDLSATTMIPLGSVYEYLESLNTFGPGQAFDHFLFANVEVSTSVTWEETGLYSFSFPTAAEGIYAVLVKYKNEVIAQINPVLVDVVAPLVDNLASSFTCQLETYPNRTTACVIDLKGDTGAHSGDATIVQRLAASFSTTDGDVPVEHYFVWGGVGKVRLWFVASAFGSDSYLTVAVQIDGTSVPAAVTGGDRIYVAESSAVNLCRPSPHVNTTIALLKAHADSRSDAIHYGDSATQVSVTLIEYCESPKL
ncbi:hypothetical protein DIPPA_11503 [Diplonema papillatum]|nr:hypothetical protein DIPPA_11503 [Diplonema papillatum]